MKNLFSLRTPFAIAFCILIVSCDSVNPKMTTKTDNVISDSVNQQHQNNKAIVLKFYQALKDTNWTMAKSLIGQDYKHHFVKDTGFGVTSWSGFERGYRMSQKAFPDWELTIINVIAEGEYVSALLSGQGTHLGEFAGIPATNVKAKAPIMLLHQIKDGKIVADWEIMNSASFLEQLKKK